MLKEHAKVFRRLTIATDLALATVAFFLAYFIRDRIDDLHALRNHLWFLPLFVALWGTILYYTGMYASFRLKRMKEILFLIYQAAYLGFFVFAGICYAWRIEHISRAFVFLSFFLAMLLLAAEKVILIRIFRQLRRKGFNYKNILLVGTGPRALRFARLIRESPEFGLHIIGLVNETDDPIPGPVEDYPVLGMLNDIPRICKNNTVDQVLFAVPYDRLSRVEEVMPFLEDIGARIDIAMDYFSPKLSQAKQTDFFGIPLLSFHSTPEQVFPLIIKRLFDLVVSGAALVVLSPVFALTALAIKLTSPGPVFFVQERGSLNGRTFRLYKFRTMVVDAEARLKDLAAHNEMQGAAFKMKNDPRVTPPGRWLRKFSIDELPQLWNVFRGDMSLVGPRPPLPSEIVQYDDWHRRRLSMRPGITCLWQISGRNKITDFSQWAELDLKYIDNWSLWLDLKILVKTIPAVLLGVGAK